eukprot:CAMPEP_0201597120 /NCGR_PEP_ID=MMETSP0190_2-20130828/193682_1 /ASSEMBLY_ACC=CAM_ASM_000263 /TAXON_ID=37353 /ORGANISM="Rosalina sp." /LENGTH=53 /DNA_ID=CAMNT_0048057907 /DNA_START=33 /DNA_END=194 /DNA_ORIENTATION=-
MAAMGNNGSEEKAKENENNEWPPTDEATLKVVNKGKKCPITMNEENVATFAMG